MIGKVQITQKDESIEEMIRYFKTLLEFKHTSKSIPMQMIVYPLLEGLFLSKEEQK